MGRWALGRGAALALAAAALLLIATGLLTARSARNMLEATALVRHTLEVLVEIQSLASSVTRVESGSRGFVLSGDDRFLDDFEASTAAVPGHLAKLDALTKDHAIQQGHLAAARPLLLRKVAFVRESIELRRTQGVETASAQVASGEGRQLMSAARASLAALEAEERELLAERLVVRERQTDRLALLAFAFTGASVLFLGLGVSALNRASGGQQRAERRARFDATRLQVTLNSCGDALIATDAIGRVTLMNPVAQALTGWRESDAQGLPIEQVFRIINEFSREAVESPVAKVLRDGKTVGLANHTSLIARDGSERPIDDSGAPIRDDTGETHGVILVFRDVTSRKLSEQARERLVRAEAEREAAVSANRAKDEFLAVLSHELRNPLAGMLGWVEVLRSSKLGADQVARAIDGIERSAQQQKRLVSDLLDVSRIVAGRLPVERGPLDWNALVAASVEACRALCESHGVVLYYTAPSGPVLVTGDPQRLAQVVENLISNAAKFSDPGGRVDVTLVCPDGFARLVVADQGLGIAPDQLERIFDRFWQAASPRARRQEGLGLGLAIAKHIVDQHDGRIEVESAGTGKGTRFTIELPLERTETLRPPARRVARDPVRAELAGVRLLLVDDEHDGREALALLLTLRGAEVVQAASAAQARDALGTAPFDVVVTDIGMPREDGYALLRTLREEDGQRGRRTALIAVTGFVSGEDRDAALAAGFDEHIGKPAEVALLVSRIRALLDRDVETARG